MACNINGRSMRYQRKFNGGSTTRIIPVGTAGLPALSHAHTRACTRTRARARTSNNRGGG